MPNGLIRAAVKKTAEMGGLAFDARITLSVQTDAGTLDVPMSYTGNYNNGYTAARLAVAAPSGTIETQIKGFESPFYVLDTATREWGLAEGFRLPVPLFISRYFSTLYDAAFVTQGTLESKPMHVLSGELRNIGSADEGYAVTYWIDVEDGLFRRVEASGKVSIYPEAAYFGDLSAGSGTFTMTLDLSEHGKQFAMTVPELQVPLFEHDAVPLDDQRILVTGGFTGIANNNFIAPFPLSFVQIYDPEMGTWTFVDPVPGHSLMNSAIRMADDSVLIVGVGAAEGDSTVTSVFDPADDSLELLPAQAMPDSPMDLALLADGRVLAVGIILRGPTSAPDPPDAAIFDPESGEWSQRNPHPEPVDRQTLVALRDGRAMVVSKESFPEIYIYDPSTDTWEQEFFPPIHYFDMSNAVRMADGRVLITGGTLPPDLHEYLEEMCDPAALEMQEFLAPIDDFCQGPSAMIYDPRTGEWYSTGPEVHPGRIDHTLTLLQDGRILAAGGQDSEGDPEHAFASVLYPTTAIYDPRTNAWSTGPELAEPRYAHTATLLPDGRVVLIGGIGQEKEANPPGSAKEIYPLNSVEILGPF